MHIIKLLNNSIRKIPTWLVYIILSIPALYYTMALLSNQLGPDPIRSYERIMGQYGIKLLVIVLVISPLRDISNINFNKFRRLIGVMSFIYICLHFLSYLILDQSLSIVELWNDIIKRPYITLGIISAFFMLLLAITSNNFSIRTLGVIRWKKLHKFVYIIGIGGGLHFLLLTKTWQIEPIIYCTLIASLLFYRIIKFIKN